MARRILALLALTLGAVALVAAPAFAECNGGLIGPGHTAVLVKATALAAWHDGYEHYVTGFEFTGPARSFGYIIPLPGVPTRIEKGGDWTLERLQGEIGEGPLAFKRLGDARLAEAAAPAVQVLQRVRIDSLNVTVVRGGGPDVARWAKANGFDLSPDAPRVLGAYSAQGAVFALARHDAADALRTGLVGGQGVVVQFTIRTPAPWMPLRILAFGKSGDEPVDADLFVLTDRRPWFSPRLAAIPGMRVRADEPARASLLGDLRTDRGMSWLPPGEMWLTALTLQAPAATVTRDLSIDGGGPVAARAPLAVRLPRSPGWPLWSILLAAGAVLLAVARREQVRRPA